LGYVPGAGNVIYYMEPNPDFDLSKQCTLYLPSTCKLSGVIYSYVDLLFGLDDGSRLHHLVSSAEAILTLGGLAKIIKFSKRYSM